MKIKMIFILLILIFMFCFSNIIVYGKNDNIVEKCYFSEEKKVFLLILNRRYK